ncbi:MAG: hypothetical protein HS111_12995 [Kofleriaceae bacterium]|nr:hypothetical protein [Kofleriaceae bacterium]
MVRDRRGCPASCGRVAASPRARIWRHPVRAKVIRSAVAPARARRGARKPRGREAAVAPTTSLAERASRRRGRAGSIAQSPGARASLRKRRAVSPWSMRAHRAAVRSVGRDRPALPFGALMRRADVRFARAGAKPIAPPPRAG